MGVVVRSAVLSDLEVVVEFNRLLAWESEHKRLDEAVLRRGVQAVFEDRHKGFYLIAEVDGERMGQLLITEEWSDWREGWFWWIQSVYVREIARRRGVFRSLFGEVSRRTRAAGDVVGLRLYVEKDNRTAQETYARLGMRSGEYFVMEKWPLDRDINPDVGQSTDSEGE